MWVDEFLEGLRPDRITLGLDRIRLLSERLGITGRRNNVIVAGTNGKGSTCAYLASILKHAGVSHGLFTSPHLVDVRERIVVDGFPISSGDLTRLMKKVEQAMEGMPERPTYFEALTAAAMLYFREKDTDLNILEVGLGGRFDSTNFYPAVLNLIAPVSMDHMPTLGRTLPAIAYEKAGILKDQAPVFVGPQRPSALKVIRDCAAGVGAELTYMPEAVVCHLLKMDPEGMTFSMRTSRCRYEFLTVLLGRHQMGNAALAAMAAQRLSGMFGFPLAAEGVALGIARARWPGRLQSFRLRGKSVLADAAHNPHGARTLARALRELRIGDLSLYYCAMKDKRPLGQLRLLEPLAREIHLLSIPGERSMGPGDWTRLRNKLTHPRITIHEDLAHGFSHALRRDTSALFTGSIYFLGEFYKWSGLSPSPAITPVTK
jgi:dihydrofolate synthase/folylpolyglutamate synthase